MTITVQTHDAMSALVGREVKMIEMKNHSQMAVRVLTLGGILFGIDIPDAAGVSENILMQYDHFEHWRENPFYLNAVIGPSAGRMEDGLLDLGASVHSLDINNSGHCLHGGAAGFHRQIWDLEASREDESVAQVTLSYNHPDGLGGFPGDIAVKVVYTLHVDWQLDIEFFATTDQLSHLNMTHHNYYNLSGNCKRPIDKQSLWLNAKRYFPLSARSIPMESSVSVEQTPFDFTTLKSIDHAYTSEQMGLDHPFDLEAPVMSGASAAVLFDRESGRKMELITKENALVVYTQNVSVQHHMGICFEAQKRPNTVCPLEPHTPFYQKHELIFSVFKAT